MGQITKKERLTKQSIYDGWALAEARKERAMKKLNEEERRKTDPECIREDTAKSFIQSIYLEQKTVYETLYLKMRSKADELESLILKDLKLDENINNSLTVSDIFEVFDFYKDKGLMQLKASFPDSLLTNYVSKQISPYQKLFKNLIEKRAEFLIVAPKERLTLSAPYTKLKTDEFKLALVENLAKNKIFNNYEFREKYKDLFNLYLANKENSLEV